MYFTFIYDVFQSEETIIKGGKSNREIRKTTETRAGKKEKTTTSGILEWFVFILLIFFEFRV